MTAARIISDFEKLRESVESRILSQGIQITNSQADYLVVINLGPKLESHLVSALLSHHGKAVVVFASEILVKELESKLSRTEALVKYVFVGELFDKHALYGNLHKIAEEIQSGQIKSFAPTDEIYVVSISQASEFIVRELFTYAHAKELLLASKIKASELQLLWGQREACVFEKSETVFAKEFRNAHQIDPGLQKQKLMEAFEAKNKDRAKTGPVKPNNVSVPPSLVTRSYPDTPKKSPISDKSTSSKFKLRYLYLAILPLWLLILPFIVFFASAAAIYVNFELAKNGKIKTASDLAQATTPVFQLSTASLKTLSSIPLAGVMIEPTAQTSEVLQRANEVLILGSEIATDLTLLKTHVLEGGQTENFKKLSSQIYYKLSEAQKSLGYLLASNDNFLIQKFVDTNETQESLQLIASVRKLALNLPQILGSEEPREYLVLLQNNMELRPTGGFIGSFALVRFEKGRLVSSQLYDVYSADGQLKGYVRPPEPILSYLGEESWFLRDSNWDPDFEVTARRTAWFLEKSIGEQVDGVVAINLNLIADALNVTGPINLIDFSDQISAENIFTKLQSEVEEGFFPGSRKKAHYLTAFSDGFIQSLGNLNSRQILTLGEVLAKRFQAKDIQFAFLQNPNLNSQVLGKTTSVEADAKIHFVEANLGVNKVNLYVERQAKAWVKVGPNQINYIYKITFTNNSPKSNPPESTYGVYTRILAKNGARFEKVEIEKPGQVEYIFPELKEVRGVLEAGVFTQVTAGSSQTIMFSWVESTDQNFSSPGEFSLKLIKQSGVEEYPVELNLQFPVALSLTGYPSVSYNTLLNKDKIFETSWK